MFRYKTLYKLLDKENVEEQLITMIGNGQCQRAGRRNCNCSPQAMNRSHSRECSELVWVNDSVPLLGGGRPATRLGSTPGLDVFFGENVWRYFR